MYVRCAFVHCISLNVHLSILVLMKVLIFYSRIISRRRKNRAELNRSQVRGIPSFFLCTGNNGLVSTDLEMLSSE